MTNFQEFLLIKKLAADHPLTPPGDPRLWEALKQKFGANLQTNVRPSTLIHIEWESHGPKLTPTELSRCLGFPGIHEIQEILPSQLGLFLQIRKRGTDPDPMGMLLREWLKRIHGVQPKGVWIARQFEFIDTSQSMVDILNALLSLGGKSGILNPSVESARLYKFDQVTSWPEDELQPVSVPEVLSDAVAHGTWAPLRQNFMLTEKRPREEQSETKFDNPVVTLLQEPNLTIPEPVEALESPPLSFIAGLPKNYDAWSNISAFRNRCEVMASHYDRSVGMVLIREHAVPLMSVEPLSRIPIQATTLGNAPSAQHKLYMLGPWDARNPVAERRVEWLLRRDLNSALQSGEILDGEQDWLAFIVHQLTKTHGWNFERAAIEHLNLGNFKRNRFQRIFFFWAMNAEQGLLPAANRVGIPAFCLGEQTQDQRIKINGLDDYQLPFSDIFGADVARVRAIKKCAWEYPEMKSPTYGLDRAMVYPDQYLVKITQRQDRDLDWANEAWITYSGDRYRSVKMRTLGCSPLRAFRWADGRSLWAEALGSKAGWSDIEPEMAGIAAVDSALRWLIALGAMPSGGSCTLWMPHPEDGNELEKETWAAYLMALRGATQTARFFGLRIHGFNSGGISQPKTRQEIWVNLRAPLGKNAVQPVPGFRMSDEVLYAVGPRPAFIDAGSKILPHVKVYSNHIVRLNFDAQLELYQHIHRFLLDGTITSIRPVEDGGIAEALGEMALWSGMGMQIRPTLPVIELFSGQPGRFVVGVLPSRIKTFESAIKNELLSGVGVVGGEKIIGMPLKEYKELRGEYPND